MQRVPDQNEPFCDADHAADDARSRPCRDSHYGILSLTHHAVLYLQVSPVGMPMADVHSQLPQQVSSQFSAPLDSSAQVSSGVDSTCSASYGASHLQLAKSQQQPQPQPQYLSSTLRASHDLDANAQWLEVLASSSSLPSSSSAEASATAAEASSSSPLLIPAPAKRHGVGGTGPTHVPLRPELDKQVSEVNGRHHQQPPATGAGFGDTGICNSAAVNFVASEARHAGHSSQLHQQPSPTTGTVSPQPVRRHAPLRKQALTRSCSPRPDFSTELDSSSSESTLLRSTHRSQSRTRRAGKPHSQSQMQVADRQMSRHHEQGSSDESDQMTFAEAAGIRRRPDETSWPAYGALQEGRQVRLLDRNSPVPPRSTPQPRQHRALSREARSAQRMLHLHEAASAHSRCLDAERYFSQAARSKKDGLPGDASRKSGHRRSRHAREVVPPGDNSSSMLDRLLTAWQQGAHEWGLLEPDSKQACNSAQPASPPDDTLLQHVSQAEINDVGIRSAGLAFQRLPGSIVDTSMHQKVSSPAGQARNADRGSSVRGHPDHSRHSSCEQLDAEQSHHDRQDDHDHISRQLEQHPDDMQLADGGALPTAKLEPSSHTAPVAASDALLASFWDTWQDAARDTAGASGHYQATPAVDIPSHCYGVQEQTATTSFESPSTSAIKIPSEHHHRSSHDQHQKHAARRNGERVSSASTRLHWRQRQDQHHTSMPSRALKQPAAAAAAASRLLREASSDPLEALLQMHPGLDPVVADLILQVSCLAFVTIQDETEHTVIILDCYSGAHVSLQSICALVEFE